MSVNEVDFTNKGDSLPEIKDDDNTTSQDNNFLSELITYDDLNNEDNSLAEFIVNRNDLTNKGTSVPEFKAKRAVVDTSALIKAPLDEICKLSEVLYTCEEVFSEIKDKKTKQKMKFVPNYLQIVVPNENSYQFTCDFSRKAGCYNALSKADLKIIALTHQLHVEVFGSESINTEPTQRIVVSEKKKEVVVDSDKIVAHQSDASIPGFHEPNQKHLQTGVQVNSETTNSEKCGGDLSSAENEDLEAKDFNWESDDSGDWITTENIKEAQKQMEKLHFKEQDESSCTEVACVTLDFAMQSILCQMGLVVMSVDGVKMSKMKSYCLRCTSCCSKTFDISKVFCPNCGSKTLKKLFYSVNDDGSINYHFSKSFVLNTRGLKYHAPRPQGGKHAQNPWVAEDQRFPRNQAPKRCNRVNDPLDPNWVANSTPFIARDTNSRFFNIGMGSKHTLKWKQRNPNENTGGTGNRRRNKRN